MAETLQKDEVIVRDIIDTARDLFKKTGFKKTTMGDIARSLGKAKSSLYYYYPSKEDIFEAVLYTEMDELLTKIREGFRAFAFAILLTTASALPALAGPFEDAVAQFANDSYSDTEEAVGVLATAGVAASTALASFTCPYPRIPS